jgi:hypothetical protein
MSKSLSSEAAVSDDLRRVREQGELRLSRADWILTGVEVALFWMPLNTVLTIPLKMVVTRYLKNQEAWLFSLAKANTKIAGRG